MKGGEPPRETGAAFIMNDYLFVIFYRLPADPVRRRSRTKEMIIHAASVQEAIDQVKTMASDNGWKLEYFDMYRLGGGKLGKAGRT